jgi:predicted dehydrogenase
MAFANLTAAAAEKVGGAASRLSVALVGPGARAGGLMKNFFDVCKEANAEFTAVGDLWSVNREKAVDRIKQTSGLEPKAYKRLEDVLNDKSIDAVILATPDHAHAQQIMLCLQAGKHIYCEKPFANRLEEANAAIDAERKSDRVVTIGTQRRSDPRFVRAAELVQAGAVGEIIQVWQIHNAYSPYRWRREAMVKAVKEADTDWKAFLMGRPMKAFDPRHYAEFRLFRDYSSGIIDQWMTHQIDAAHMLTGITKPPISVMAQGGNYVWKDYRENGDTVHVSLDYGQGFQAFYSTTLANGFGSAGYVLGRQGTLEFEYNWKLSGSGVSGSKIESQPVPAKEGMQGTMDQVHMRNWLDCVHQGKKKTNCTAEHGYQHAITCIMADQALHSGRRAVFEESTRTIRIV